ncbi:MAG: 7-cyano-7-deazaguanine synthase QueC [Gammaproteobacteria bacterium]|nr:MAG: 7-cyano-7-deazaguanine synthase QueC [Gammaproteobacteria bacterium]
MLSNTRSSSDIKPAKAIVLLSGGLDSATVLAIASQKFDCHALSFNYAQRSLSEIDAARQLADVYAASFQVVHIDEGVMAGSALTDDSIAVPEDHNIEKAGIPVTYVPARNTLFLSHALAVAEVMSSQDIFIGVNAVDYSGYPDCRPEFIRAYESMANLATKAGVEGKHLRIHTPLIDKSKAEIISMGNELGVDYALTVSCYQANDQGEACGSCDSCQLRRKGFEKVGASDPTRYF